MEGWPVQIDKCASGLRTIVKSDFYEVEAQALHFLVSF